MKTSGKIKLTLYLFLFAGAALFTVLLIREGVPQVGAAVAKAGWGIAAVVAYHFLVPVFLDAAAWWSLFPRSDRLPLHKLFWMRWVGESVSTLVPSAAVGGDVVRARLAAIDGAPLSISAASVIVDVTLGVFTQAGFTLLGLLLIVDVTGQKNFVGPTLLGTLVGVLAVAGFYFVQRLGMFRFLGLIIARLANSPEWQSLVQSGETLDRTIRALYTRRRGVVLCCAWTTVSLVGGSGEIWIALHALGLQATLVNAVILQSMVLTIRSVAFPVPGGLGVQEGGYLVVGNLLGIPGDAAFALSLIARVRELALGIPGLITWQWIEGSRLVRARLARAGR
ncbi:MAG: TIGR00374 family protein [Verrucomicrobia bacterium]|nr:MAG: TIGR00374 family protein [Verrucomicrobiota bacterium]PYK92579.1 MAG: TIGR00374 family protein [Verrucomicrobiota bacterium]PYL39376.1 MAG: TIGR00374 family protein [Verrucomicrobiota bacterium]